MFCFVTVNILVLFLSQGQIWPWPLKTFPIVKFCQASSSGSCEFSIYSISYHCKFLQSCFGGVFNGRYHENCLKFRKLETNQYFPCEESSTNQIDRNPGEAWFQTSAMRSWAVAGCQQYLGWQTRNDDYRSWGTWRGHTWHMTLDTCDSDTHECNLLYFQDVPIAHLKLANGSPGTQNIKIIICFSRIAKATQHEFCFLPWQCLWHNVSMKWNGFPTIGCNQTYSFNLETIQQSIEPIDKVCSLPQAI